MNREREEGERQRENAGQQGTSFGRQPLQPDFTNMSPQPHRIVCRINIVHRRIHKMPP